MEATTGAQGAGPVTASELADTPIAILGPVLDSIGIAVFVIRITADDELVIDHVNRFYEREFNVSNADFAGRTMQEIFPPDLADAFSARYRRCIVGGERIQYDEEVMLPAGLCWFRTILTPWRSGGRVVRIIGTTFDFTDRRRLEAELESARDHAEIASAAKSAFLANMSHELRTPLNAIIGFSEMIGMQALGPVGHPKYREYIDDIAFAGRHLLGIVNDLLDLARIESGEVDLQESDVDPAELVGDVARLLAQDRHNGPVPEAVAAPPGMRIRVDARLIRQALVNLVSNARKFTPAGGRITMAVQALADGGLALVVSDTGRGIAMADLPRALAPFGRIESVRESTTQGVGLGLPITRALIEQHGGRVHLNSRPGAGTTVYLVLPPERVIGAPTGTSAVPTATQAAEIDGLEVSTLVPDRPRAAPVRMPVWTLELDRQGTILHFSVTDAGPADLRRELATGLNLFRDLVSCSVGQSLRDRLERSFEPGGPQSQNFGHVFGTEPPSRALVELRPGARGESVWIFVRWA